MLTEAQKLAVLHRLLPYVSDEDAQLTLPELTAIIADRVEEDFGWGDDDETH